MLVDKKVKNELQVSRSQHWPLENELNGLQVR